MQDMEQHTRTFRYITTNESKQNVRKPRKIAEIAPMTDPTIIKDTAMQRFEKWFQRQGHWIYVSREQAVETWKMRGIEGLPNFPK
jgi:hypothetical protein